MKSKILLLIASTLLMSACSTERFSYFPSYKLQIIQGNVLDEQAVAQLRVGMTANQVQLLLGTPLLQDPFHANRWDYTYEVSRNGIIEQAESRNLTIFFKDGVVSRIEGLKQ